MAADACVVSLETKMASYFGADTGLSLTPAGQESVHTVLHSRG